MEMAEKKSIILSKPLIRRTSLELDVSDLFKVSVTGPNSRIDKCLFLPPIRKNTGTKEELLLDFKVLLTVDNAGENGVNRVHARLHVANKTSAQRIVAYRAKLADKVDLAVLGPQDGWKRLKYNTTDHDSHYHYYETEMTPYYIRSVDKSPGEGDGKEKIFCLVEVITEQQSLEAEVTNSCQGANDTPRINFAETLLNTMSAGGYTDFVIRSGSTGFPCHKVVLAARSEVFKKMLDSGLQETLTGELRLDCLPESRLKMLVDWLYGRSSKDNIVSDLEAAMDFLPVVDRYQLNELKQQCEEVMKQKLSTNTTMAIAKASNLFGMHELHSHVINFIATEYDKFVSDDKLLEELRAEKELDRAVLKTLHSRAKGGAFK